MLSKRIQELKPSPTLSLDAKVKELQARGIFVVNLTLGEPDFSTPKNISQAAIKAINEGFTHYTSSAGIVELREAIAKKLFKENKIAYLPSEIIVGVGTKQLLYSFFQTVCQENDEVLVPTPTWSTYVEQIKLSGAKPVLVPLKNPFQLTAQNLEKHLTRRTKAILLNSPANPTGAVIEEVELKKIAQLAVKKNLLVISDEIYEKILYQGKPHSIASLNEEVKERTITINGFSKAYAMTGWRVGYAAGPKEIIEGMITLSGQTTSGTSSISQKAALAALLGPQESVGKMIQEFKKRRDYFYQEFSQIKGVTLTKPTGAFYLFLCLKDILKGKSSAEWAQLLLEKEKVAVVPGEAFLVPGYVRLSYAASMKSLKEGLTRIKKFIEENSF